MLVEKKKTRLEKRKRKVRSEVRSHRCFFVSHTHAHTATDVNRDDNKRSEKTKTIKHFRRIISAINIL